MSAKIVLSLMRSTGLLHLGNYLGAARDFVEMDESPEMECYFGIADLHALTSLDDAGSLRGSTLAVARDYLAAGIDPERSAVFLQSDIPETSELFWLLCNVTAAGELQGSKTFKEMSAKQPENVNAGLLNYPILMAADILGPQADFVPVGEDQLAHLEMARNIAKRFNHRYGETLQMPAPYRHKAIRIPGLDGQGKMSKSDGNGFAIADSPEEIWAKLRPAFTDPARKRREDPGNPEICPIGQIHRFVSPQADVETIEEGCRTAGIGCIDCKKLLHKNVTEMLEPIRERHARLTDDDVRAALASGAERTRRRVRTTLDLVRGKMGL
ncbi:MAG: tryptophan--tRNA ligase [Planctomycetota bacterium]|jgi:tryptophanyl-tRNA synthetase